MEVTMGGVRTHRRTTLTPSQSSHRWQSGDTNREEATPPTRSSQNGLFDTPPRSPGLAPQSASPPPFRPNAHAALAQAEEILLQFTYADVRAAQDYLSHYGLCETESAPLSFTAPCAGDAASFSTPLSLADRDGLSTDGIDLSAMEATEQSFADVEHEIIWGTASPLELLHRGLVAPSWRQQESPLSAQPIPRPLSDPVQSVTPLGRSTHGAGGDDGDCRTPFVTRAIPFTTPPTSPTSGAVGNATTPSQSASPTVAAAPGWSVHDFEWGPKLDENDRSKSFMAWEKASRFPVELKCLSKEWLVLSDGLKALRHEIALQRRLSDAAKTTLSGRAYVQGIHAYFWDHDRVYLALESTTLAGECRHLEALLAHTQRHHVSEKEARRILSQVFTALAFVHAHGIIHRRVQTSTLLISANGTIKLSDFSGATDSTAAHAPLPWKCALDFVAPEILRDGSWTCAADMWSAGVVAWRLLCGALPDELASPQRKRTGLALVEVQFPPQLSNEARDLLQSLLNDIPEQRLSASAASQHPFILAHTNPQSSGALFTPTRAVALPEAPCSSPSPSPSLRPLMLTSILKKNASVSSDRRTESNDRVSHATPPTSPIPSVSALSGSQSWHDYSTPPSARVRRTTLRPSAAELVAVPVSRQSSHEDASVVSLSTCSFSVSLLPPSESRLTTTTRHGDAVNGGWTRPHSPRGSFSGSAGGGWAANSTTLNISSLTALTSCGDQTVSVSRLSNSDDTPQRPELYHVAADTQSWQPVALGKPTLSDADSPVPSPARSVAPYMARRKLSYSSASLDSLATQGVSASRPQPSSSQGRGDTASGVLPCAARSTSSLSLASLTAMTSVVPMTGCPLGHHRHRLQDDSMTLTSHVADCAQRLQFEESSSTTSDKDRGLAQTRQGESDDSDDGVLWHRHSALREAATTIPEPPAALCRSELSKGSDENCSPGGQKRRERCVVVLSPLTVRDVNTENALPSFGSFGTAAAPTGPSLSFSDSLLVSPMTQSLA